MSKKKRGRKKFKKKSLTQEAVIKNRCDKMVQLMVALEGTELQRLNSSSSGAIEELLMNGCKGYKQRSVNEVKHRFDRMYKDAKEKHAQFDARYAQNEDDWEAYTLIKFYADWCKKAEKIYGEYFEDAFL